LFIERTDFELKREYASNYVERRPESTTSRLREIFIQFSFDADS